MFDMKWTINYKDGCWILLILSVVLSVSLLLAKEKASFVPTTLVAFSLDITRKFFNMSLQRQLEAIQVAYSTAVAENQLEDDFAEHLAEGHSEEVKWTQDHSETMLLALDMRGLQIVKMTSKLSQFQSICREDRFLLHHYNQDLFKQYILAKYMKTWDGNDCLQLLCDNQQVENPQRQLFYDLNQWGNFLPDKIGNVQH